MKNKVVVITGSSIGIGRETAFNFAEEGCKVAVTYYQDKKEAEKVVKRCIELGASDIILLQLNLVDNKSIKECVNKAIKKFNFIDVLINNAGIIAWKSLREQSFEEIEAQIRTNLEGLIKMTKVCLPYVKEMIINVSSGAGKTGYGTLTAYCATKFGVRGFTQALAEETKIKVYSVNPDMTSTRMTEFKGRPPQQVARIILNTAKGIYKLPSGSDIDVWEYA